MKAGIRTLSVAFGALLAAVIVATAGAGVAGAAPKVMTLDGFKAPGTPAKYNKVKVLKQGPKKAKKIMVLIPGTSAGASNFRPMANAILQRLKGWQIWSIERRENLLEDHSYLKKYVNGEISNRETFDYYLGWLADPSVSPRFVPKTAEETAFAREWGLKVAVHDIRKVVKRAGKRGRKVVLGGHSLGGSITTAYATWNFNGRAGARDLDGLVFIDGAGGGRDEVPDAADARAALDELAESPSPFNTLVPPFPWAAGVFNATGSTAAVTEPHEASTVQSSPIIPSDLKPPVPVTNLAQYGYAVDADTGPASLMLVQSHIGRLAPSGNPRGWQNGELGTATRAARVFAERDGMDGTSWYHPLRLSIDAGAVDNGIRNSAQPVFGIRTTRGRAVKLPMYSFDAVLGNGRVAEATRALAKQSGVPKRKVRTVNRAKTFAHIDPLSALPAKNDFVKTLVPFLRKQIK
jgi:pimeloyl-ACP methyl ester carboxylesterase